MGLPESPWGELERARWSETVIHACVHARKWRKIRRRGTGFFRTHYCSSLNFKSFLLPNAIKPHSTVNKKLNSCIAYTIKLHRTTCRCPSTASYIIISEDTFVLIYNRCDIVLHFKRYFIFFYLSWFYHLFCAIVNFLYSFNLSLFKATWWE